MNDSKLVKLLAALNPEEFRQFYRYLKSPFFNKSEDVLLLFGFLKKYYPTFEHPKLTKEKTFAHLYPKKEFNSSRLRNLFSKITKILEGYFIYLEFEQQEVEKKKLLTKIYGQRNLTVIFKKNTTALLEELSKSPFRDTQFFYDNYRLESAYYFHIDTPKQGDAVKSLKASIQYLEQFYALEKMRLGVDLKNRAQIFSENHDFDAHNLTPTTPTNNLLFDLFKKLICLCETEEEILFFQIKAAFINHINQIPLKDGLVILPLLLNYAIRALTKKETQFSKELLELYQIGIQSKILIQDHSISGDTFLNIAILGTKLKEFTYVQNFMETHKTMLNPTIRIDIEMLSIGFLHFHQQNYEKVIHALQSAHFLNILHKMNAKTLLIRTYYELFERDTSYFDLVISNCLAFEKFTRRSLKFSEHKKEACANFSFLVKKITRFRLANTNKVTHQATLTNLLNNFTNIYAKGWLKAIIQRIGEVPK